MSNFVPRFSYIFKVKFTYKNQDIFLFPQCPRSGLQLMVNKCSVFMKQRKLKFSTNADPVKSKTKCIIFSKKAKDRTNVAPIKLNGDDLPWVPEVKHLGNILECSNTMKRDVSVKRGRFVGKLNSLSQEFFYTTPDVFMKILNIYAVSFYGSGLWDLFSGDCERLYKAWNVAVRLAWKVPNTTHRYLIEVISDSLHPKVMLASRYTSFVSSLLNSPKYPVRILARLCASDCRTVMGRTLSQISRECGLATWDPSRVSSTLVKTKMKYSAVPHPEEWRTGLLKELLSNQLEVPGFTDDEIGCPPTL